MIIPTFVGYKNIIPYATTVAGNDRRINKKMNKIKDIDELCAPIEALTKKYKKMSATAESRKYQNYTKSWLKKYKSEPDRDIRDIMLRDRLNFFEVNSQMSDSRKKWFESLISSEPQDGYGISFRSYRRIT